MIRRILAFIALLAAAILLAPFAFNVPMDGPLPDVAAEYVDSAPGELGAANLVTSVIVTYRGLDTLGEVAVLFAATAAVGLLLKKTGREEFEGVPNRKASEILETGGGFLFPLIILFGVYIFLHGHLTPGGSDISLMVNCARYWLRAARQLYSRKSPIQLLVPGGGMIGSSLQ